MQLLDENRRLAIMLDYCFGRGVSRAVPKEGMKLSYSRRSGRVKSVSHDGRLFATVKPNGAIALSVYGARLLAKRRPFRANIVSVNEDAAEFVARGKSVFCKFVTGAGGNVYPRSEVAIADPSGRVIAVGMAIMNGRFMKQFNSGVAVKVREGSST